MNQLFLIGVVFAVAAVQCGSAHPEGVLLEMLPPTQPNQKHIFSINNGQMEQAERDCRFRYGSTQGGLVVIESEDEFKTIERLFEDYADMGSTFWVHAQFNGDTYVWLTSKAPVGDWINKYWETGFPGNPSVGEGLQLSWRGRFEGLKFRSAAYSTNARYICEVDRDGSC